MNAKAKDSEWVRQRQALEAAKPSDVNEVLLVSQDGAMTEGLTSNFFVLSKDGEVVTAQDGVLDGTVRQVILKVSLGSGLAVCDTGPACPFSCYVVKSSGSAQVLLLRLNLHHPL